MSKKIVWEEESCREGFYTKTTIPTEVPRKSILQPVELHAGCSVCLSFPALRAVVSAGMGFADATVSESFVFL